MRFPEEIQWLLFNNVGNQWICGCKVVLFLAHKEAKLSWNKGYLDDKKVV
jgi:hypothetical protein